MIRELKDIWHGMLGGAVIDRNDISGTVFLAGTGRSGTTWLEEVLNYDNSFRVMFEPFHSRKIELLKDWNYRQYIRPGDSDLKFIEPAKLILSGRIRNPWIDKGNRKHFAKSRMIKDIRANLILKWIKCHFPEIPMILILRHPCAVASSKLKNGWDSHLDDFLVQSDLVADYLAPFQGQIERAGTIFDKHIFMWCIENLIPLKQFAPGEVLIIFYENICIDPMEELKKAFSHIGKSMPPEITRYLGKASSETRKDSAVRSGSSLLSSWRRNIDSSRISRAMDILALFGLHRLYAEGDLPLVNGEDALMMFPPST